MSISKKCVVCDKEFTAKNDKGIYCSPSCRVKAHRKREKGEQNELAKNITEEYSEELSFFRMQLNDMYEDVQKLQSEMVSLTKYLYAFAEKVTGIPDFQDTIVLKNNISDLSDKLHYETSDLKEKHEEKIIKNDENIKMLGFKINQIIHIINDSPLNHKKSVIDKLLDNENLYVFIEQFTNNKSKAEKKTSETS